MPILIIKKLTNTQLIFCNWFYGDTFYLRHHILFWIYHFFLTRNEFIIVKLFKGIQWSTINERTKKLLYSLYNVTGISNIEIIGYLIKCNILFYQHSIHHHNLQYKPGYKTDIKSWLSCIHSFLFKFKKFHSAIHSFFI